MPSWKDTFPGSGMRKQATITKGHQHKENLLIPKFCASLPDPLAIGCYATPALRHWSKGKIPGFIVRSWGWCQEKPSLLATLASEIQNQGLTKAKGTSAAPQAHPILHWHDLPDTVFLNTVLGFQEGSYVIIEKNVLTWCNICFQFLTFVSYYLHKLHQTLSLFPHWHKGIIVSASCSYENQMGYCIWNFCETNNIIQGCAGIV